jgi:hypothetical protein
MHKEGREDGLRTENALMGVPVTNEELQSEPENNSGRALQDIWTQRRLKMTMLREAVVPVQSLYLDPNNPRFADLQDRLQPVAQDRVTEQGVQDKALARILDDRFEVDQLKDSIRSIGFLTVDRLVVTPLTEGRYVVIEGNRRLGAIKSLLEDHKNGEADLSDLVQSSLREIPVLSIDEPDLAKREHFARVLQGVRHVAGIRPWGPYQQAQVVALMLDDGKDQAEICEVLGLPKRRINILRRCFRALEQMRQDDDYGDKAKPSLFSAFDEAFKLPTVRDEWLGWEDDNGRFLNEQQRKLLYSWLVGAEDEDGNKHAPKINDPKEIRKLPQLMTDSVRFKQFCDNPALSLDDAMQGVAAPAPSIPWREHFQKLLTILNQVPAVDLESASDTDEALLRRVKEVCDLHLRIINSSRT